MRWIASRIRWIMLVAGVLTCTMAYAIISPQAALLSTFGVAVVVDSVMIALFAIYLVIARGGAEGKRERAGLA